MIDENQRLKAMLAQASQSYNALQMHFVTFLQQQQHLNQNLQVTSQEHHELGVQPKPESEKNKEDDHQTVPRQYLERGRKDQGEHEPLDETSSEERTVDDKNEGDHGRGKRDMSQDSEDQGWVANKLAKLSPSSKPSGMDQVIGSTAEAMMRKARVSVRARSEASMVSTFGFI